jgi:hypothetical protein
VRASKKGRETNEHERFEKKNRRKEFFSPTVSVRHAFPPLDDARGDTRAERRHERHDHRLISKNGTENGAENSEDALLCRDF